MLRILTNWRFYAFPWILVLSACRMGEEPKPASETRALGEAPGLPGRILKEALAEVDLSAEQRAKVDDLIASTRKALAPTRQARSELLMAVAASVRAGAPDEARIRAKVEALKGAFTAAKPTLAENLNQLHGLLDASQRKALVAALRGRIEAHVKAQHGEGPHGMRGHHGPPKFLRRLAEALGVTDEQRQAIHDRIHEAFPGHGARFHARRGEMKRHLDGLAAAFQGDRFDAHAIDLPGPHHDHQAMLDKAFGLGRTVASLLSADQRERLAAHLEERAKGVADGLLEE